jgi:hypothetical protein
MLRRGLVLDLSVAFGKSKFLGFKVAILYDDAGQWIGEIGIR